MGQNVFHYVGLVNPDDKVPMRVSWTPNNLVINKNYFNDQTKVRLCWRFNIEGRLDCITYFLLRSNGESNENSDRKPLVEVKDFDTDSKKVWSTKEANYWEIPEDILDTINRQLVHKPDYSRHNSIIKFGHGDARSLLQGIENRTLTRLPYEEANTDFIDITELQFNGRARLIIKRAANNFPSVFINFKESGGYLGRMYITYS